MKNTEKKQYLTPELKVIEFEVELGYAASGDNPLLKRWKGDRLTISGTEFGDAMSSETLEEQSGAGWGTF